MIRSRAQLEADRESLLRQKVMAQMRLKEYRDNNRMEFFDKAPNPGPNPPQAQILEAWEDQTYKIFCYTGGNRSGKSTIGVIIALSTLFGKFLWNNNKIRFPHNNPRKVRIVGQDWEKHVKTVLEPELRKWWPKERKLETKKNNVGVDAFWTDVATGSTLEIMSNNQESDLHEGWQGDLIYYDEPPKRDIRIANARGLVDRNGREIFCMTLLKEAWVDREVLKKMTEDGRPDPSVFVVHGQIYDNIGFGITKEGVEQFASMLTDEEKDARLRGIPAYMSGLVYPTFSRKYREKGGHLVKRFPIPTTWPVDIAIDVHPRKKQAILFCATDPRGDKYLCDEVHAHGDAAFIADAIVRKVKYNGYRVNRVIIDPFAKGDSNNHESVFDVIARMLQAHGMCLETATKDKDQGILEVKTHLKGPNNMPSLFVFDDMVRTIQEFEGYMWDEDTQKACVIRSTIIDTPAGQFPIKDLVGQQPWVYTYSKEAGRLNVQRARKVWQTKKRAEIWKLTMDRGVLFATPDHRVMLRDGTYKQLRDLKTYDSLMPLYRSLNADGYAYINPNDGRSKQSYPLEHQFVYECVYGEAVKGKQVHHKDGNHQNNHPDNLQLVTREEHMAIHRAQPKTNVCPTCNKQFSYHRTFQRHCSKRCRQKYGDSRRKTSYTPRKYEKRETECLFCRKTYRKTHHARLYCTSECATQAEKIRRSEWPSYNHKVISVGFYGYEAVYDIEVPGDSNFVASGVVVHNSKDGDDDMMENLYRICLLKTEYVEPLDEDFAPQADYGYSGRDEATGY